jgi:ribose 5-phosphate isomerase B
MMKIAIGCDPNAQEVKEELIKYINKKGYGEISDFGSDDIIYAHVATAVGEAVASGGYDRGILICGTGLGVSISANKVKGAYAALCDNVYAAQRARLSNDANIICIGAFTTGAKVRETLIDAFFTCEFDPEGASKGSVQKVNAFKEYETAHSF